MRLASPTDLLAKLSRTAKVITVNLGLVASHKLRYGYSFSIPTSTTYTMYRAGEVPIHISDKCFIL
jgi:hypothetical protein